MKKKGGKLTATERSWAMYDWANSVFATIVMTAIFPIYFTNLAGDGGVEGTTRWAMANSIGTLIVVVLAPICGSLADFQGMKKKLLLVFMLLGVVCTLVLSLAGQWQLMLVAYILAYIGFALGNLFYDSFLTDVTTPERMDLVSAKGYAYGYIGGSTIPFVAAILIVNFADQLGLSAAGAVKLCLVITALWWAVFSLPLLRKVKQVHYIQHPAGSVVRASFSNLLRTAKEIVSIRPLFLFMLAYFFYIDGVNTVIKMSTSYGATVGLGTLGMVVALMVTQLIAVPCSILYARLATRWGVRETLLMGASIYTVVCVVGFYMGYSLENAAIAAEAAAAVGGQAAYDAIYEPARRFSQLLFWILAALVGTSQGGMQALSRSQFGRMIPPERSNEFFGFFDVFGKFAAIMGPALYMLVVSISGRSSYGILGLIILFALGVVVLLITPKHAFNQERGQLFRG